MQSIAVFASEVAAAIGSNPYKHPAEVVESMWLRDNTKTGYMSAKSRYLATLAMDDVRRVDAGSHRTEYDTDALLQNMLSQATSVAKRSATMAESVAESKKLADDAVKQKKAQEVRCVRELAEKISKVHDPVQIQTEIKKAAQQVTSSTRFADAEKMIQETVQLIKKPPNPPSRQGQPATPTPSIEQYIEQCAVRPTAVKDEDIVKRAEKQAQTEYGRHHEATAIAKYEQKQQTTVKDNNAVSYSVRTSHGVLIVGRVDGFADGALIEVKNRRNRFMTPVYDVIQIHCYMLMTGVKSATLVERLGDRTRETAIMWDNDLWKKVEHKLKDFVENYRRFIVDPSAQNDYMAVANYGGKTAADWWEDYCDRV